MCVYIESHLMMGQRDSLCRRHPALPPPLPLRAPAPGPSKAKERSHRVVSRPGRSTAPPPVKDEPSEEEEEKKVIIKRCEAYWKEEL